MKIVYTAVATSSGGREGTSRTDDGLLDVKLAVPKAMGGMGGATNPEQLFAAGYSACFLGALKYVAGNAKIKIPDETAITAKIGIGPRDDGTGFGINADLTITIPGLEKAVAEDLVAKAHIVCPYSHATKGNIDVALHVA